MLFEMEESRADKKWTHFYKSYQKCLTLKDVLLIQYCNKEIIFRKIQAKIKSIFETLKLSGKSKFSQLCIPPFQKIFKLINF